MISGSDMMAPTDSEHVSLPLIPAQAGIQGPCDGTHIQWPLGPRLRGDERLFWSFGGAAPSATLVRAHDLDAVARLQRGRAPGCARHDGAVEGDRDAALFGI